MRVSICIGSACHLKGSREVIQKLQKLVSENHLGLRSEINHDPGWSCIYHAKSLYSLWAVPFELPAVGKTCSERTFQGQKAD